jgi:hypothetical protein
MSSLGLAKTYQTIRWGVDMDPSAADTDSDLESLEQDVLHIIVEVQGSNLADPQNGIGADGYLSGTSAQLAAMPALIDAQLASVDRITSSHTTIQQLADLTWLILVAVEVGTNVVDLQFALGPSGVSIVAGA